MAGTIQAQVQGQEKVEERENNIDTGNAKERTFTSREIADIVYKAGRLHQWESQPTNGELVRIERALPLDQQQIGISEVYRLAEQEGVPREFVDKVVGAVYPSKEDMLRDIEKYSVRPSTKLQNKIIRNIFDSVKDKFLPSLITKFPMLTFESEYYGTSDWYCSVRFFKIERKTKIAGLIGPFFKRKKTIVEREHWGNFDCDCDGLSIKVYSSAFLSACGEIIDEIEKRRDEKTKKKGLKYCFFNITRYYSIEGELK